MTRQGPRKLKSEVQSSRSERRQCVDRFKGAEYLVRFLDF